MLMPDHEDVSAISDLYPALTRAELKEAEGTLRRYFEIAARIAAERPSAEAFDNAPRVNMMEERSNADFTT